MSKHIKTVSVGGKTIHLLSTAHVSPLSVEHVREAIVDIRPDCVCVELDQERFERSSSKGWKDLNLVQALRQGDGPFLIAQLILALFQRKLGKEAGSLPGQEMREALRIAAENGIATRLVDRPVKVTLLRFWRGLGLRGKLVSFFSLFKFSMPVTGEEEKLEETIVKLLDPDLAAMRINELGSKVPGLTKAFLEERDMYMAAKILETQGENIIAVVGAAHVNGIAKNLENGATLSAIENLEKIPTPSTATKLFAWAIPAVLVLMAVWGAFNIETSKVPEGLLLWAVLNGAFASLGAILALCRPLTVLATFVAAPLAVLHPIIAIGMVSATVEGWHMPPRVSDLEAMLDDLDDWHGWWTNRAAKLLLVFAATNMGSLFGSILAIWWVA